MSTTLHFINLLYEVSANSNYIGHSKIYVHATKVIKMGLPGSLLTFSPLYRPVPPALDSPFYRPLAPALDSHSQRPQTASTTTPSPIAITLLPLNQSPTHKTMTLIWGRLRKWSQIISAHAAYFYFRVSGTNHFIFVEFRTTFFWVSTCFNGCAAATDARLGFGTRLRWFCDRGVWWKRTFCGKFGSGNDVDWLLLLLGWVFRCQQWFEWRWQRFCCDVPDSNDSLTSRRRLIYVNLCFHLYLPSH